MTMLLKGMITEPTPWIIHQIKNVTAMAGLYLHYYFSIDVFREYISSTNIESQDNLTFSTHADCKTIAMLSIIRAAVFVSFHREDKILDSAGDKLLRINTKVTTLVNANI